ncbi:MAG: NfeD family protein [Oscillospiraceae bacterium]|nr:NfeD family protein [Oscillospiraceae bacterium]
MDLESYVWFALTVVFIIMEAATVTMVSIWFVVGALAALIVSLLGGALWLQVGLFLVLSALLLWCLRPVVKKHFTPKLEKTNVDAVIGSVGRVTEQIRNVDACGHVKLGAMEWAARSTDGTTIEEGTLVRVDRVEGVRVFVSIQK